MSGLDVIGSRWMLGFGLLAGAALVGGCAGPRQQAAFEAQVGESVLLAGERPNRLAFAPELSREVRVRSTYRDGLPQTIHYVAGRDYLVNASGEIQRTAASRIPDFSTNLLYGQEDFDHSRFPGYGNNAFFVYVDYWHREKWECPPVKPGCGRERLPRTAEKLKAGGSLQIVAYGDSITAGGDASETNLFFWKRWADALQAKYPQAKIEAINGATGGDSTAQGLQRLEAKVIARRPDLVLVGFGMNDHNRAGYGVPLDQFRRNLGVLVDRIRDCGAEVVLYSAFPPNPKWHFGSHNMAAYAEATEEVAREKQCAFADVYHLWMSLAARKQTEDLLANNINHPNDFGHWIYFRALESLGL